MRNQSPPGRRFNHKKKSRKYTLENFTIYIYWHFLYEFSKDWVIIL